MWAECTTCGLVFEPKGLIRISGNAKVVVQGSSTRCPRCGASARLIDAEYRFDNGELSLISGLNDRDARLLLNVLQNVWANPPKTQKERDQLATEIEQITPGAARLAEHVRKGAPILSTILVVITLLWTIYSDVEQSESNEELLSTTHQLLDAAEQNGTSLQELIEVIKIQNEELATWTKRLAKQATEKPVGSHLGEGEESNLSFHKQNHRNRRVRRGKTKKASGKKHQAGSKD